MQQPLSLIGTAIGEAQSQWHDPQQHSARQKARAEQARVEVPILVDRFRILVKYIPNHFGQLSLFFIGRS